MKWILTVLFSLSLVGTASADFSIYCNGMGNKVDRGFCNVLGAPILEVPYQVYATSKEKGVLAGGPIGLGKGIVLMPLRILSGSYDLATFYIPFPGNFDSWIKPAYIPWTEQPSSE